MDSRSLVVNCLSYSVLLFQCLSCACVIYRFDALVFTCVSLRVDLVYVDLSV